MKTLIKSATIIDSESDFNTKIVDILITDGVISKIDKSISEDSDTTLEFENLHISQGWFDSSVNFGEPGFEERETITHGLQVAGQSGFTDVVLNPKTNPIIDSSSLVEAVLNKAKNKGVNLHVCGALTKSSKGIALAELYDMKQHGAVNFGDYKSAIENPNLLKLALLYAQNFDGLVQSFPQDNQIAGKGLVNEHDSSTKLGLKGIPPLAEELQITRDLFILEYTGGKLHIPTISTAKSVDLIREAKDKGLDVSCSVAVHHLSLTDDKLSEFDSNYKLQPPLRTKTDIEALKNGLKDDTIDMVTSDHQPMDVEHKKVEFDNAEYGTIGLESAFGVLQTIFSTEEVVKYLTRGKLRFNIPSKAIKEGEPANFSLFSPQGESVFSKEHISSTSKNSAFLGERLKGQVFGAFVNGQFIS